MTTRYDAKDPRETEIYSMSFAPRLGVGETLTAASQTVTATVSATGTDASSILSGDSAISGTAVTQTVTGGTDGVDYAICFEVDTSLNRHLVEVARLFVRTP